MFRKDLIPLLLERAFSLGDLARLLRVPPHDLEDDLLHLQRSLRHSPFRFELTPARCRKCGFVFGTDKLHKPSKCPECRGTWLSEPRFRLIQTAPTQAGHAAPQAPPPPPDEQAP